MKVTLDHAKDETENVRTFYFKPEKPMHYTAGQFTEFQLPHDNPDDRGIKRWFTLSSSPTDEFLSITTKFAGETASSFKKTLWQLPMDSQLDFAEAMGDFVLPKDGDIPLVFVAGGLGITPFHSIVTSLLATGEKRSIEVILAFTKKEDVLFEDIFKEYGVTPTIVLSDPPEDWRGETGHLSGERILDLVDDAADKRIYVSGPEPMVETLEKDLLATGLDKNNLVFDYFPGYQPI
jgi:ferredoxin-NADP reductase